MTCRADSFTRIQSKGFAKQLALPLAKMADRRFVIPGVIKAIRDGEWLDASIEMSMDGFDQGQRVGTLLIDASILEPSGEMGYCRY